MHKQEFSLHLKLVAATYFVLFFSTHWDLAHGQVVDAFTYSAGEL